MTDQGNDQTEVTVIQLANRLSELDRLHAFFDELWQRSSWNEQLKWGVTLSCEELITNTINYGFPEGGEHFITLAVHEQSEWIEIRLEDEGIPFNPIMQDEPDLGLSVEERDIGGLGIYFVRKVMTEVAYERTESGNRIILRKLLSS